MPRKATAPVISDQEKLAELDAKLLAKRQEIEDFKEAIRLIEEDPKWLPQPEELPVFDQLKKLLEQSKTEEEMRDKIDKAKAALELAEQDFQTINSEAIGIRKKLQAIDMAEREERVLALGKEVNDAAERYMELLKDFHLARCNEAVVFSMPRQYKAFIQIRWLMKDKTCMLRASRPKDAL